MKTKLTMAGILFLSAGMIRAQLIDVDFNTNSSVGYGGGPNLGPTMSGAAVLGAAGDQWNGIVTTSGTGIPLIYANGSNSPVTMTFTSGGGYDVYSYSGSTPFAGTPYDALMEDYLYNGGTPRTITLSGLAANSKYNLVLYNAADVPGTGRITYFTVNGNTQSSTWNGSSSTLIAGVDYVEFTSAMSDGSGNLVITWTGNGTAEGDLNGFQIQFVPPPPPIVTNTNDSGPGSLREVIADVPSGETITFATNVTGTITLSSGEISVGKSLNIAGPGASTLTVSGVGSGSAFNLTAGNIGISGLTITDGGGNGAPAINNSASLTLSNCELEANFGLALMHNTNSLVVLNCTFANNSYGGLVIASGAVASVTNSTFAQNFDGIYNQGTLALLSCSIVYNYNYTSGPGLNSTGTVYVANSVIAGNYGFPGGVYTPEDLAGNFTSLGYNFVGIGDGSTGFTNGVNQDQVGTSASPLNPMLGGLQNNGGTTPTLAPLFGSPLIDQGNSFGTTTDQRGALRPFDLPTFPNAPGGDGSDIGAVEFGAPVLCTTCSEEINVDASRSLRTVDARWMGINGAVWDGYFDTPADLSLLSAMGCRALRYPGGSDADQFHWATDMSEGNTFKWATAPGNFQHIATNLGAQVFITVNYGTGTTNEAADWVRSANITNGCGFKYWEIGNECYGSWETDSNTVPPFVAHDPWTYAMRFRDYYNAMKAVDPTIKIGAVAVTGEDNYDNASSEAILNPRTGQYHYGWTPVMLYTMKTNGIVPDFLIYHYYPEYQVEDDTYLLQVAYNWSGDAANLRQQLSDYLGPAATNTELVCTENNADSGPPGRQSTSLVDGLYLADSMSQMMKTEFNALMWFCLRLNQDPPSVGGDFNPALYGWRDYGDHGVMSGTTTLYPTYYAMKLMQYFAQPGDTVLQCANADPFLSTYAARQASGSLSLLAINKDPRNTLTRQVTLNNFSPNAAAIIRSYGMPQDDATETNAPTAQQDIATNQITVASGGFTYSFPPYSLTLFTLTPTGPPLAVSLPVAGTVKISWPWPSTGWNLRQNANLTTTNWTTPPETIQNDGTNNFILITPPTGNMFFRLQQP